MRSALIGDVSELDIKFLKSFLCLYKEQNLSKASSKLYISSQGLSKQMKAMEEHLDMMLFERSSKGMKPTEFSHSIYPIVQRICDNYDELETKAKQLLLKSRNTVTIVIPIGLADVIRMETIYELRRHFSEFEIIVQEFDSEECRSNLICGKADIAFLTEMTELSSLDCYEFRRDSAAIIVNVNHPLALRDQPIYVRDLYGQKLYRRVYRKTAGDFFRFYSDESKYDKALIMAVGYDEKKLLSVTNEGAAVLDVKSTMNDISHPELRVLDIADIVGWIYCCARKGQLNENIEAVLEYIRSRSHASSK